MTSSNNCCCRRIPRADLRLTPSQWETSLQSNAVSHWLRANLESALIPVHIPNGHKLHYRYTTGTGDCLSHSHADKLIALSYDFHHSMGNSVHICIYGMSRCILSQDSAVNYNLLCGLCTRLLAFIQHQSYENNFVLNIYYHFSVEYHHNTDTISIGAALV